jgi:integrase
MHLLQAGVDVTAIALWMGHESPETTHLYVEADLVMKRQTFDRIDAPTTKSELRTDLGDLLGFLDQL